MTITSDSIVVSSSAIQVISTTSNRRLLSIKNVSANTVFIGFDTSVNSANGIYLTYKDSFIETKYTGAVYVIVDDSTNESEIRFLEVTS